MENRTASINGGFVALYEACKYLVSNGTISKMPIKFFIGAVSVGVGTAYIQDLCYAEDSKAIVDMNVVLNEFGDFARITGYWRRRYLLKGRFEQIN